MVLSIISTIAIIGAPFGILEGGTARPAHAVRPEIKA